MGVLRWLRGAPTITEPEPERIPPRRIRYATPSWAERRRWHRRQRPEKRHVERRIQDRRSYTEEAPPS